MNEDYPNEEKVSECCGQPQYGDNDHCAGCYEWAEFVPVNLYQMNRNEPAQYNYAPTQRQIAKFIKRISWDKF